jgi:hypothetical protein
MPMNTDLVDEVPEGIPIASNDVEMEEGNYLLIYEQ